MLNPNERHNGFSLLTSKRRGLHVQARGIDECGGLWAIAEFIPKSTGMLGWNAGQMNEPFIPRTHEFPDEGGKSDLAWIREYATEPRLVIFMRKCSEARAKLRSKIFT